MASGDKIYLADKETLDSVLEGVNTLITQVRSVEHIAETTAQNDGTTTDTGGSAISGSIFAKLNAIITHLLDNWTKVRATKIDSIYSWTLTDATANATGTLSQKLSYIIKLLSERPATKYPKSCRVEHTAASGTYSTNVIKVNGPGYLEAIYTNCHSTDETASIQIIVDGADVTPAPSSSMGSWVVRYLNTEGTMMRSISNPDFNRVRPLHFSQSLVINATNQGTEERFVNVDYCKYE